MNTNGGGSLLGSNGEEWDWRGWVVNLRLHGLSAGKRENGLYLPASIYGSAKPRIEGGGIM